MKKQNPLQKSSLAQLLILLSIALVLISCEKDESPEFSDDIYQVSTLDALLEGDFDGRIQLSKLSEKGNFGVGTFGGVDGEMVVLEDVIYQITVDGAVHIPDLSEKTPFAVVKDFREDQAFEVTQISSFPALQQEIDANLQDLTALYAVRVRATFESITIRSVARQNKPYPTLAEVVAQQSVYDHEDLAGTLVGFRLPPELEGINATGYHFHFISDDRSIGGHVLDCQVATAQVTVDQAEDLTVTW